MNSQTQILNPSYSLRQSNLSMGKQQPPSNLFATSQVNLFPGNPQQQYFVTSSLAPQQPNPALQTQQLTGSRLNINYQPGQLGSQNSQAYAPNIYKSAQVFQEKPKSESRITYHPYVRTYIDYEERVVLVPVERVKINYYEKIYETQYVPQAVEQIVTETVPVEKEVLSIRYIPVEQKIVHFPKEEKKAAQLQKAERKILYFDANGNQISEESFSAAKLANASAVAPNSQQNIGVPPQNNAITPTFAPVVPRSSNHQENSQPVKNSEPSERYQEEQQIILTENKSQHSKKLGESHVKEVFKPTYDPMNEPQNAF